MLTLLSVSCAEVQEPDFSEHDYGHVQFKLYKEASYEATKAMVSELDYLGDVSKVKVTMRYGETLLTQTLVMTSYDEASAEYGLRSDRLKLLAGSYDVVLFTLYDKQDKPLYESSPSEGMASFEVVAGGLCVHDLLAKAVERGKVRFSLVKDMSDFTQTKAASKQYTFDEISYATIIVRIGNVKPDTLKMLPVDFSIHFTEDDVEDGYQTSSFTCDSLISLRAGDYQIVAYEMYDSGRKLLETNDEVEASFSVSDNRITDVDVPVRLYESD